MSGESEGGNGKSISVELGDLNVEVHGEDMNTVRETFEDVWDKRLEESAEMKLAVRNGINGYE